MMINPGIGDRVIVDEAALAKRAVRRCGYIKNTASRRLSTHNYALFYCVQTDFDDYVWVRKDCFMVIECRN